MNSIALIAILAYLLAPGSDYRGPRALGPFRLDRDVSVQTIAGELLGRTSKIAGLSCYRQANAQAYLSLSAMGADYNGKVAGSVVLSRFPNCLDRPVRTTSVTFNEWHTPENVHLGSTLAEVRRAYGPESSRVPLVGSTYRSVIIGDATSEDSRNIKRPELGEEALIYTDKSDQLITTIFGIKSGRVAWIRMSKNE